MVLIIVTLAPGCVFLNARAGISEIDKERAAQLQESGWGTLAVQYHGRISTLDSFARTKMFYITGRKSVEGLSPLYVAGGMLYNPERWEAENIIPVKRPELKKLLDLSPGEDTVSVARVLSPGVRGGFREIIHGQADDRVRKDALQLFNRAMRIREMQNLYRIVPPHDTTTVTEWYSPFSDRSIPEPMMQATAHLQDSLVDYFSDNVTIDEVSRATEQFALRAADISSSYPTHTRRSLDSFNARNNLYTFAMLIFLVASLCWFLYYIRRPIVLYYTSFALTAAGLLVHVAGQTIRFILAGYVPLSNMYESLTFFVAAVVLIALISELYNKRGYAATIATFIGFIVLVVLSKMPPDFSRITPLQAVLNSAWLTYHVISCMLSYSAFALAFLFSILYLIQDVIKTRRFSLLPSQSILDDLNYRFIQLGWPLLTIGILTGAVWADTAWGKAWSWDPKETWSLITWLIYAGFLHVRIIKGKKGTITAIASVVGFLAVLITWFGVSYLGIFGGGLHGYA